MLYTHSWRCPPPPNTAPRPPYCNSHKSVPTNRQSDGSARGLPAQRGACRSYAHPRNEYWSCTLSYLQFRKLTPIKILCFDSRHSESINLVIRDRGFYERVEISVVNTYNTHHGNVCFYFSTPLHVLYLTVYSEEISWYKNKSKDSKQVRYTSRMRVAYYHKDWCRWHVMHY